MKESYLPVELYIWIFSVVNVHNSQALERLRIKNTSRDTQSSAYEPSYFSRAKLHALKY